MNDAFDIINLSEKWKIDIIRRPNYIFMNFSSTLDGSRGSIDFRSHAEMMEFIKDFKNIEQRLTDSIRKEIK